MSDITPELLRRTAFQLEEDAAEVRRAVDGLVDLAGPDAWQGAQPWRITFVQFTCPDGRADLQLIEPQRHAVPARGGALRIRDPSCAVGTA